jgi:hypothetical protein
VFLNKKATSEVLVLMTFFSLCDFDRILMPRANYTCVINDTVVTEDRKGLESDPVPEK